MYIDEQSKMNLNGVPQFVSIRAEKENAPLPLYLHGGPGDAALPLVMKHNKMLEQKITVVVWEQRGAGKSYYKFDGPVTIDVFMNDLHTLVNHLLARFHQSSLYLLGHSWGSILGLRFVQVYPELVRTYIGCGQVVNMRKSSKIAYVYALEHADKKSREKLRAIDCSYQADSWLNDLLFVTMQVVKHKGSLYGKTNYSDLVVPFLFSRYYTLADLIRRQKGSLQAIQYLWQEVMQTDFEAQTQYGAPLIFIEGRCETYYGTDPRLNNPDNPESKKWRHNFMTTKFFLKWI